jgi:hypothetical protein
MVLPNIDRTIRTGKCLSESRVENGSMVPEREERGAPRGGYPSFICQRRNYFALFSSNAELGGGKVGEWLRAPLEGKFGRELGWNWNKRVLWIPVNIVDTSVHQHAMDTEARRPHRRSPLARLAGLRVQLDKQLTTRRQQKKNCEIRNARLQVAPLVAVVRVPHLIVWRR